MDRIECPNCDRRVQPAKGNRCPHCNTFLHPDPIKRREADLVARLRRWFIEELPKLDWLRPSDFTLDPDKLETFNLEELTTTIQNVASYYIETKYPDEWETEAFRLEEREEGLAAGMIHHVFIQDARERFVVNEAFCKVPIEEDKVASFALRVKKSQDTLIEETDTTKFIGKPMGRGVVILCTDRFGPDDQTLQEKLDRVTYEFGRVIKYEVEYEDFMEKVSDYVTTALKVCVIGYEGTGKTDLVTLLNGGVPPISYEPEIDIDTPRIGGARIGTLEITTWDFAGQERYRKHWELCFRGSRIILLTTDSTLENVLNSKDILDLIRRKEIAAQVLAIANKQDYPSALSPKLIEMILAVKTIVVTEKELRTYDPELAIGIITEALKPEPPSPKPPKEKPEMTF